MRRLLIARRMDMWGNRYAPVTGQGEAPRQQAWKGVSEATSLDGYYGGPVRDYALGSLGECLRRVESLVREPIMTNPIWYLFPKIR